MTSMKWSWTEEERRAYWEKWKARGKAAFLWRVGMLGMALPWGAVMLVYFLFIDPDSHELREELPFIGYVELNAVFVVVSILVGLLFALATWLGMRRKYG